jgi:peptidyl-prolyl cis-trans isomerase D
MIGAIRSLFDSWIGRLLALAFVVLVGLAFALSDVSGTLTGNASASTVAKVGGETITSNDLRQAIDTRHRQAREQNPNISMSIFVREGGADTTLEQLINIFLIAAFANESGIGVSDRMIDSKIAEIPGVVDSEGKVNRTELQRMLGDRNMTEEFLRQSFQHDLYVEQLLPVTSTGLTMPVSLTNDYASMFFERRMGRSATLPSTAFAPKAPPSDAVLTEYYKKNSDKFTLPERRSIRYALFTPAIVGDKAKPTDKEISDYYAANADAYSASKIVSYEQIIVPTEAVAKSAQGKLSGGASIDSVAKELGFSATKETVASQSAMAAKSSDAVAKAVFATATGGIAAPAQSDFGWHVVRVSKVENRPARSLAEARSEIFGILEKDKGEQAFADMTADMQDRLEDGDSLTVVAKEYGLTVESTPKILSMGLNPDDPNYKPRAELAAIIGPAFQMGVDDGGSLVEVEPGKTFALFSIIAVDEAAPAPLKEIRANVIQSWAMAEGQKAAKAAADKIVADVKGGKTLEEAVATINAQLPPLTNLSGTRQELAQAGPNTPMALFTLFEVPLGGVRAADVGNDRGYFVISADRIDPAKLANEDPMLAQFATSYQRDVEQELQRQFVNAMRNDVTVEINDSAISAAKKQLTGES